MDLTFLVVNSSTPNVGINPNANHAIISNPNEELYRIGQVEPTPEPAPDNPEGPGGGNEDPAA